MREKARLRASVVEGVLQMSVTSVSEECMIEGEGTVNMAAL